MAMEEKNGKRKRCDETSNDQPIEKKRITELVVDEVDRGLWLAETINKLVKRGIEEPIFRILDLMVEDGSLDVQRLLENVLGQMGKNKQAEWKQKIESSKLMYELITFEFQECKDHERRKLNYDHVCEFKTTKRAHFTIERLATLALFGYLTKGKCYKRHVKTIPKGYDFEIVETLDDPPQLYTLQDCLDIVRNKTRVKLTDIKGLYITRKPLNIEI